MTSSRFDRNLVHLNIDRSVIEIVHKKSWRGSVARLQPSYGSFLPPARFSSRAGNCCFACRMLYLRNQVQVPLILARANLGCSNNPFAALPGTATQVPQDGVRRINQLFGVSVLLRVTVMNHQSRIARSPYKCMSPGRT